MNSVIVTTPEQLTAIIENAVNKILKCEKPKEPERDNLSGTKEAVQFLNQNGYEISSSLFTKQTAKGVIPCKRFHNRRLIFSKRELLNWAESKCVPVRNDEEIVLALAKSANRKLARR
ncbi:MAG: DNA-binding protein [Bacteroidales bacterium]|jgi:hypothetical protein|nr:DNA-binding protein [Bacteroidales bacterium]